MSFQRIGIHCEVEPVTLSSNLVGERSVCSEAGAVRPGGANRSANAGMSSDL